MADRTSNAGKLVLVAHPEPLVAGNLHQALKAGGFTVNVLPVSGAFDEETLLGRGWPDAIVAADGLKTEGGEPLHAWIRRRTGIPFVGVCAKGDHLSGAVMLEMGADVYMTLPLNGRELVSRIHCLIRRYRITQTI